jgi:hypothetical protein
MSKRQLLCIQVGPRHGDQIFVQDNEQAMPERQEVVVIDIGILNNSRLSPFQYNVQTV